MSTNPKKCSRQHPLEVSSLIQELVLGLQAQELSCPIKVVSIHSKECDSIDIERHSNQMAHYIDLKQRWPDLSGVYADGAVLVRPDGHVQWRLQSIDDALGQQQSRTHSFVDDKSFASASDAAAGGVKRDNFELQHIISALKPAMQRCLGQQ